MAKYRSASLHILGSQAAPSSAVPHLTGLEDTVSNVVSEGPVDAAVSNPPAEQGPMSLQASPASSRPRARAGVAPAWLAGAAAALALLGLVIWGGHDALGSRKSEAFPCPPATTSAVQAATGCAVPPPPAIDGEDEE